MEPISMAAVGTALKAVVNLAKGVDKAEVRGELQGAINDLQLRIFELQSKMESLSDENRSLRAAAALNDMKLRDDKSGREDVVPLTPGAVAVLRELPSRGIGDAPVFPSNADPAVPTGRNSFQIWLRRAKATCLRGVSALERETLRSRLKGIGYHAEKRAAVRSRQARQLPPKIQEAYFGTRYETLKNVYDEVAPDDIRLAMTEAGMNEPRHQRGTNREGEQRKISRGTG